MLAAAGMSACSKEDDCDGSGRGEIHSGNHSRGCGRRRNPHRRRRHGDDLGAGRQSRRISSTTAPRRGSSNSRPTKRAPPPPLPATCPSGSYSLAAAHYPYSCGATFDAVNKVFNAHVGHMPTATDESGRLRLHVHERLGNPVRNQRGIRRCCPSHFTFRPLMARIRMKPRTGQPTRRPRYDHHQHQRRRNADRRHDRCRLGNFHRIVG